MLLNDNIWLILLSLAQSSFAMFVTFGFISRIYLASKALKRILLPIYAIAMGSGLWGIYFANFFAFENSNQFQFSEPFMLAAWLLACSIGYTICHTASKKRTPPSRLFKASVFTGLCAYAMFYCVTLAIHRGSELRFDTTEVAVSLVLVIVTSLLTIITLSWAKTYHGKNILLIKGLLSFISATAIIGLHFIFSASIFLQTDALQPHVTADKKMLAAIIALAIICLFLLVFTVAMFYEKHGNQLFHFSFFEPKNAFENSVSVLDGLTNLPNRAGFKDNLNHAISRSERSGKTIALAYIDLDHFKPVNDNYGHHVGDIVLANVATRLGAAIRGCDSLARIGGDEFVAIIEGIHSTDDVIPIVERMVNALRTPFLVNRHKIEISCSMGIAIYTGDGNTENLMMCADSAMYKAKEKGKNQFRFYDAEIALAANHRLTMQQDLTLALENKQFSLVFQPKQCCITQAIVGAEALIHWQHPTKGLINAEAFIPVAEQLGLMNKINDWMIKEACRAIYRAKKLHIDLNLSVNLPRQQLKNPQLVKKIVKYFNAYDVATKNLTLTIKETDAHENAQFKRMLAQLKAAGVRIALNDFGLHPFALNTLKDFNLDEIKLNKTLLSNIDHDSAARNFTEAIIQLAQTLNFNVVANGVESDAVRQTLAQLGCNYMQAYLADEPILESKLFAHIKHQATHATSLKLESFSA